MVQTPASGLYMGAGREGGREGWRDGGRGAGGGGGGSPNKPYIRRLVRAYLGSRESLVLFRILRWSDHPNVNPKVKQPAFVLDCRD